MGEVRDIPPVDGMTGIAFRMGLEMIGMFARGPDAVMAAGTDTGSLHRAMVEIDSEPGCQGGMTDITLFGGGDMFGMFTGGGRAVMT